MTLAVGSAVTGTRALLSDSVSLTANSYSVGSVNLRISKNGSDFDKSQPGFTKSNMLPGQSDEQYFWLKNLSDTPLALSGQLVNWNGTIDATKVMLKIQPVSESNVPIGTEVGGTLNDWYTNPQNLQSTLATGGTVQKYKMTVAVDSSVSTPGLSANFDLNFVGTQTP